MCRSVEEITEKDLIVQELDKRIADSGSLVYKVLRKNYIAHEQNTDNQDEIMGYIKESKKSPSIIWLLKNKPIATLAVLFTLATSLYIVFHLVEYYVGFQQIVESVLP